VTPKGNGNLFGTRRYRIKGRESRDAKDHKIEVKEGSISENPKEESKDSRYHHVFLVAKRGRKNL